MNWIIFTILAIIFQTFRNIAQKNLNQNFNYLITSWSCFLLSFPFSIVAILLTLKFSSLIFLRLCLLNTLFQMSGNLFLTKTLNSKNFSIGVAFSKTETVLSSLVGHLFFKKQILLVEYITLFVTAVGSFFMAKIRLNSNNKLIEICNISSLYGLLCGICFAFNAFYLKEAAFLLINKYNFTGFNAGITVLLWTFFFKNIFFYAINLSKGNLKSDLYKLLSQNHRKEFFKAGIFSLCGSSFWYAAFSVGDVVYVKALGQFEIILAIIISRFLFKNKIDNAQNFGIALTIIGILILLLFKLSISNLKL